jgi:hypothetical protein
MSSARDAHWRASSHCPALRARSASLALGSQVRGVLPSDRLLVPLATRGYTRKAGSPDLVFGANGQRSPTATWEMMPAPRKLSAAVLIQASGVALIQVTPLA